MYKSYKSTGYLTLDKKEAKPAVYPTIREATSRPPAAEVHFPLQPLNLPERPPVLDTSILTDPLLRTHTPVPSLKDSVAPPGPVGEVLRTGTFTRK